MLEYLFYSGPKQSIDSQSCCRSGDLFGRCRSSHRPALHVAAQAVLTNTVMSYCNAAVVKLHSYSLCDHPCCVSLCFGQTFMLYLRPVRRSGGEMSSSQQGGSMVVCRLENAHWGPHLILMAANKAGIQCTLLIRLTFILSDMAEDDFSTKKRTLSVIILPGFQVTSKRKENEARVFSWNQYLTFGQKSMILTV